MPSRTPVVTSPFQSFLEMSRNTPPKTGFFQKRCVTSTRKAAKAKRETYVAAVITVFWFLLDLTFNLRATFLRCNLYHNYLSVTNVDRMALYARLTGSKN